jgi:ornithine carbamoyltransferase
MKSVMKDTLTNQESTKLTNHFLTGEELSKSELQELLNLSQVLKQERSPIAHTSKLQGQHLIMLFDKPSLRTRLSFSVAMNELGGHVIESISSSRKSEEPEDTIRVLNGYGHAVMVRTFEHKDLDRMAAVAKIPIINGLSNSHHPCQALADLLTLQVQFKKLSGLKLTYLGDGNNVLNSLLLLAPFLGVHVHYACPAGYEPDALILREAKLRAEEGGGSITAHADPFDAASAADALYTDVWASMGFEQEESVREVAFEGFQLNKKLLAVAKPTAVVMHCMPMIRGQEISDSLPDHPQSVIFEQSSNRLHVQKALLLKLMSQVNSTVQINQPGQ